MCKRICDVCVCVCFCDCFDTAGFTHLHPHIPRPSPRQSQLTAPWSDEASSKFNSLLFCFRRHTVYCTAHEEHFPPKNSLARNHLPSKHFVWHTEISSRHVLNTKSGHWRRGLLLLGNRSDLKLANPMAGQCLNRFCAIKAGLDFG